MSDYLFIEPESHDERLDRQGYILGRIRKGNPVSIASVIWAELGVKFRPPEGWKVYCMIMTFRGQLEIQGPFKHAQQAADYVNGTDMDSMLFALDPATALEWDETDDKYVMVPIVKAPI